MSTDRRVVRAQLRAHEDAEELVLCRPDGIERFFNVAVGDPQAPLETFLRILDLNGLLGDNGRLRPEVGLVSMGDHFDWGRPDQRRDATDDGTRILSWLAAHPPDQVQLLLGNHDLVRVGEFAHLSDEEYVEARQLADEAVVQPMQLAALQARFPTLASAAVIARDYSCFDVRQRNLVARLLKARRFRLAIAPAPDLLLVHAGVTFADLELLGPMAFDALTIAAQLNGFLDLRVTHWKGEGPLDLAPLHQFGSAKTGEARGILAHRPANPLGKKLDRASRRYDPRELPTGVVQVIGHINDKKCRELMADWADSKTPTLGSLRGFKTNGGPRYHEGCHDEDRLVFLDGAMHQVDPVEYELFDLELRQRLVLR
ncbi:MAG: transcriptional regulator [Myxococcota bacterium]